MTHLAFTVRGTIAPKGSRTLGRRGDGSTFTRPASRQEHRWVQTVARECMAHRFDNLNPPYRVDLRFLFARPGRPAHPHPSRLDVDKCARAALDGLVLGQAILDDRHVTVLHAVKAWSGDGMEGCEVTVRSLAAVAA